MNRYYEPEFKKKIIRLHLEEGRSLKSLAEEYNVSKASITNWTKKFREECQTNEEAKVDYNYLEKRKAHYHGHKEEIKSSIREIYNSNGMVDGYRTMQAYLARKGHNVSRLTVHNYINTELNLEKKETRV